MPELNFRKPVLNTPEWWLLKLSAELDVRNDRIDIFDDYYSGVQKLDFATPKFREAFGWTFSAFSDNWCKLVIDAVNERIAPTGFRYGKDAKSDDKAWKIWQQNDLDGHSIMGQQEALINEESYLLVWPDDDGYPKITVEHPTECFVAHVPGSRTKRAAALKRFVNDDGYLWATLYLPDGLYKFQSSKPWDQIRGAGKIQWEQRETDGEAWPLPNRLGREIPVVPVCNDPRLLTGGVSELADAVPLQDAINKTIMDLLVTSEFTAAPQRWATGISVPKDEDGKPIEVLEKLINRIWASSNPETSFGQFPQADLSPYVNVIEMFVTHFASRTRTPPHYFYLNGQFPSGEAVKSAETGLVAKARRKMITWGEAYEETMRLAFVVLKDKRRSQEKSIETVWKDPESRTEGEHIDATVKKRALGVPLRQLWEDAGYTPTQIERFWGLLQEEAALGLLPPAAGLAGGQKESEIAAGVGSQEPTTAVPTQSGPTSGAQGSVTKQ